MPPCTRLQSQLLGAEHCIRFYSLMELLDLWFAKTPADRKINNIACCRPTTYKVEAAPLPKVDSKLIRDTRKRLHCSRAVFARRLRINERTLEKWEQGRAKPNPQAAALVLLVRNFPDTLDRLERVALG